MVTLNQVIEEMKKNNRVCPQPQYWNKLYDLLPNKQQKGNGWEPPAPLILAAWWETSAIQKIQRLREHIHWAFEHDHLDEIYNYLTSLKEEEWHHLGE